MHQNAVHSGIIVGQGDLLKNLGLGAGFGEVDDVADDVGLLYINPNLSA